MPVEFLSVEDVLTIHDRALADFGGSPGLRDAGALESAVAMPQAGFGGSYAHDGLFEMAAAYAFHIAQNQPFIDGNKRAGLGAALVFLDLNGVDIVDEGQHLYEAMISFATRTLEKKGMASLLRDLSQR